MAASMQILEFQLFTLLSNSAWISRERRKRTKEAWGSYIRGGNGRVGYRGGLAVARDAGDGIGAGGDGDNIARAAAGGLGDMNGLVIPVENEVTGA